jgi:hypothetical protein
MPPVIIGAGIAAAGAVGSAVVASKSASKAAKTTAAGNNAAIASQEKGKAEAAAALAPWQGAGLQANGVLQDALGFNAPQTAQQTIPSQQPNALAMYQGENPDTSAFAFGGGDMRGNVQQFGQPQGNVTTSAPQGAQGAFDNFLHSINYNWQLQQGQNALNSGYAGRGVLQSGDAIKRFADYNQNMARGAYQDWFGGVENMANRGYGAAAAQAGVSTNTANNISNLNSANANALAQIQIAKGNNTASLIGGLGQIGGYVAGNVLAPTSSPTGSYYASGGMR